jgi:SNF2 family DNA or RNA helicase
MVMNEMPPKLVRDVYLDLGTAQRERYEQAETEGVLQLDKLGEKITIEHVFELIRSLKQICNFDPVTGESAKVEQLRADMEEIAASGQKALVFSQWVTTLDHLQGALAEFAPLAYHGKVPSKHRDGILKEFRENSDRPLLLLSYGTGAVGLNLQFSNYVFLFDRWWNPAIEDQAINRAHRIGQKDRVLVSRFITPGTIEERIAEVLAKKRELFSFLIDDHDPAAATGLSHSEIFGLFNLRVRQRAAA